MRIFWWSVYFVYWYINWFFNFIHLLSKNDATFSAARVFINNLGLVSLDLVLGLACLLEHLSLRVTLTTDAVFTTTFLLPGTILGVLRFYISMTAIRLLWRWRVQEWVTFICLNVTIAALIHNVWGCGSALVHLTTSVFSVCKTRILSPLLTSLSEILDLRCVVLLKR